MTDPVHTEALVAAKWWADTLRNRPPDQSTSPHQRMLNPRSTMQSDIADAISTITARQQQTLTLLQIDEFECILAEVIAKCHIQTEGWERAKTQPHWGSAARTIMTDYGACEELRASYQAAGGGARCTGIFPIKTVMWLGPGTVSVRCGYGSSTKQLMPVDPTEEVPIV